MDVSVQNDFIIKMIDHEKGKGMFANRPIKEGDVILTENPIVSCQFSWNLEYGYLTCDYCMAPLETAEENVQRLAGNCEMFLPHMGCCKTDKSSITECLACGVKYCSLNCQNEAFKRYHSTLCLQSRNVDTNHPLVQLNEMWKRMHYPPETATVMLLARMVAMVNQADNKEEVLATFSQFRHHTTNETHEIAHNLLGEKFAGQIDILRQKMQEALNVEHVAHWFTPDGFRSLLALIGTNAQGIGTNAFSRWVKNVLDSKLPEEEQRNVEQLIDVLYDDMDKVVGAFLNNEGSGLYVLQSSVNHSCAPNAIVEFPYSNYALVLRARRDILIGEEICISYLDDCNMASSRHTRQKALRSLYLFVCNCEKCQAQANDPDVTSDEEEDDDTDAEDVEEEMA
ncbi:hypothetical protein DMN91_001430 [Ooceraea biroi]|uniref:Protein-lysine N-trimethyltransferase SMYD5 n=1 Tax=Ooceraea biroi TaxID=2015173 RepID=A0A026WV04_OOCBI|nr:SET and MYND domain-containing protein 5 [Ooceraea biroi]EZA59880.1 SET and MYND domain-containing protein [Ooceraea biroi]RLU27626.1 hypothetical protein DMN91_001430 [Ooceraea biroi]